MLPRCLFAAFLCLASSATAQEVTDVRDVIPRSYEFGGSSEILTEGYSVSGREARRPSGTARLLLRPYLRFGESFELTADILVSTEQRSLGGNGRQRINRFGLSPTWSWGQAQIGDFNHAYTPLTYQGIPIRGGGLHLHPGWLRFSVLGGVTQRAVAGDASNGSYGRQLFASRIGVGHEDGSYFDLIALYADDDVGSLQDEIVYDDPDTTQVGTLVESSSVTPQENLVLGTAARLSLLDRRLTWNGEFATAAYTRDKRAPEIDDDTLRDVPSWLTSIFTPRHGSNLDFAWSTDLRLRLRQWDLGGEYEFVGPGYRSLGVGSLLVDRRVVRSRAAYQSRKLTASVIGSIQRDNVLGQKLHTTRRNGLSTNVGLRVRPNLSTTAQASFHTMSRGGASPDMRIDYLNQVWGTGARLAVQRRWVRSVGLDYRLQDADDSNPARSASAFLSHQVTVPVGLKLSRSLQLTPAIGAVWIRSAQDGWRTTHTEKLALRHTTMERRWISTFSVGSTFADGSRRLVLSLNSNYRLSERSSLRLVVRRNDFTARAGVAGDWTENIARLSVETRW